MSRTVLVVDDSAIERVIVRELLQNEYNIIEASGGKEAIALLHEKSRVFSAIVLDIVMPGMDGFEVLRAIKGNRILWRYRHLYNRTDDDEPMKKAISLGADGFSTKPFSRNLLHHVIRNAIKLRETAALVVAVEKDKLTGIYNFDAFKKEAERMVRRRPKGFYSMLCIDIDNFKIINEQYGVDTGDAVLRHVASVMEGIAEKCDGIAGRYMADKFMIMLPHIILDSPRIKEAYNDAINPKCILRPLRLNIGRCIFKDRASGCTVIDRAFVRKIDEGQI